MDSLTWPGMSLSLVKMHILIPDFGVSLCFLLSTYSVFWIWPCSGLSSELYHNFKECVT